MKTTLLAFLVALLAFATPSYAATAFSDNDDVIGTILEVEGLATIATENGRPQSAKVDMPVHVQDIIATGPRARVYLQLIDNTELTLGENGRMVIDDYLFDDQDVDANRASYSFLKGAFLYVSGLVAKKADPDVTVNIPYGSIGIRGTKFWGGDIDGEYGVIVGEGQVVVQTNAGRATLSPGQGTMLRGKNAPPGTVKTWQQDKINRATATIALKNPAAIGKRMLENQKNNTVLRERHRTLNKKRIESLRKTKIETDTGTDSGTSQNRKRLLELKREKERRLNGTTPENTVNKTLDRTTNALKSTGTVEAKPLRSTVETTTSTVKSVTGTAGDTVRATTDAATDTVKKTVDTTVETTKTVTEKTGEAVKTTVDTTKTVTEPVVNKTTNTLKNTTKQLLNKNQSSQ